MGYKFKPNKSVAKRFRVTGTGKLKMRHTMSTHLRSARDAAKKRFLGRPAILPEGHARNMRELMGIKGVNPARVKHLRTVRKQAEAKAAKAAAPASKAAH